MNTRTVGALVAGTATVAILLGGAVATVSGGSRPSVDVRPVYGTVTTLDDVSDDDPRFDCMTMGDHVCGDDYAKGYRRACLDLRESGLISDAAWRLCVNAVEAPGDRGEPVS